MRTTLTILIMVISIFTISNAVVPDLLIDGIAVDQSQYRLNDENEDFRFQFESNTQRWSLLSDESFNNSTNPSFGLYNGTQSDFGLGFSRSIIFNGKTNNYQSFTTNFSTGDDVGFWLSQDLNNNSRFNNYNSIYYSERGLSVNDKQKNYQSFIMYDVRNFGDAEYSFGDWSGSGNYDYLMFIEDKTTDGIDHDDIVVGMMVAPEPGTLLLLTSGLLGTGLIIRRKKKLS